MTAFWIMFRLYLALLVGGTVLASVPSWLLHGIPHHTPATWAVGLAIGFIVMVLASALLAWFTLKYCNNKSADSDA